MFIKYVDLPAVPEELLDSIDYIIENVGNTGSTSKVNDEVVWASCHVNDRLAEWSLKNISSETKPIYQLIYPNVPIHIDHGALPNLALNYILKSGGDNVVTTMYDERLNPVQSMCIEERKWHTMEIDQLHGVENITDSPRISLKICFDHKNVSF